MKINITKKTDMNKINSAVRTSERGAAMIIALIVIAAFIVIASAASKTVSAISAEAERTEQTRQETARADYYVSMAEATLKYDVRRVYNDYQIRGKRMELRLSGTGDLPFFDPLTVTESHPLLNLDGSETGTSPATATSLYGASAPWAEEALAVCRTYIVSKFDEKEIKFPELVEIKSLSEAYRRTMTGEAEPIYAFRYTVRATSGEFAEVVKEDMILLGPVLGDDSPVIVNCSDLALTGVANPSNVIWGNSTQLNINYTRAERVVIYNQGGAIVYNQVVTDEPIARDVSYATVPLTAPTVFVAEAVRGTCQIQVPITVGVTFAQNIAYTVNGVQSVNIIEGENVRYDWSVTDADPNYTTSFITYGSDPTHFFENVFSNSITQPGPSASTTSVLHVRDTRYNNNAEQTATINISVCRLARVVNFTVTPSTVTAGNNNNVRFDWQTEQAGQIRIIRISDGQIIHTSNNAASGNWTTVQPQATTDYRIEAISECGAPLAVATTRVTVNPIDPCPPPTVTFSVTPGTVVIGANQMITLTWSVSGTATSVSINNGVGSNLPLNGSIQILQPQTTTTYILTASGDCGGAQSQQTVQAEPTTSGSESCDFDMNSEPICSVTNVNQCGPHRINGQLTTNGNNFTLTQTHTPFGAFGTEYLSNVGFSVYDSQNVLVTQGAWSYTSSGTAYWNQQPAGAGTLSINSVTVNGNLPTNVSFPLRTIFTVGYGANAGFDVKTFDTSVSPGGCGNPGGSGQCSTNNEAIFYCEENTNTQFTRTVTTTFTRQNGRTYISVYLPLYNYPGGYFTSGAFTVTGPNGFVDSRTWTTNPQYIGNPSYVYVERGFDTLDLDYPGTSGYSISGNYTPYISSCTIIPPGNGFTFESSDTCGITRLFDPETDVLNFAGNRMPSVLSKITALTKCG